MNNENAESSFRVHNYIFIMQIVYSLRTPRVISNASPRFDLIKNHIYHKSH